jgi:hypothetical protein
VVNVLRIPAWLVAANSRQKHIRRPITARALVVCLIYAPAFLRLASAQISYNGIGRYIGGSDSAGDSGPYPTFDSSISASGVNGSINVSQTSTCLQGSISGTFFTHIYAIGPNAERADNYMEVQFTVPKSTPYHFRAQGIDAVVSSVGGSGGGSIYWLIDYGALDAANPGCTCAYDRLGVLPAGATHTLSMHLDRFVVPTSTGPGLFISTTNTFTFTLTLVPALSVSASGSDVAVQWPEYATNFVLESTTRLNPPMVWAAVTNAPATINGFFRVTVDGSEAARFFRLREQ